MDTATVSRYLFTVAAMLNGVSVLGHLVFANQHLYPTVNTLKPSQAVGAAAAKVGFEHMTVGIFCAGKFRISSHTSAILSRQQRS
jgi:hypothetical protein